MSQPGPASPAPPPAGDLRTHRPPWAPVVAVVWSLLAVVLLVDLVRRGDGDQVVTGGLVLLASVVVAYVFGLQPCVAEWPDGVEVVNPLRRVRLRWADLRDVVPRDVLVLVTDAGEIRCTGVVGRGRTADAGRQATRLMFPAARGQELDEVPAGRASDPAAVAARITSRWEAATRHGSGGASRAAGTAARLRWHRPSLVLLAAAAAMVVVALVV